VLFAGGLVFVQRVPTTPHAQVGPWQQSLAALAGHKASWWVPSHGPVRNNGEGVLMTQRYLQWLDTSFRSAAERGLDMNELLRQDIPSEFRGWAALVPEYTRNVAHLYPRYEQQALRSPPRSP
jgi:hypothetical protein